MLNDLNNKTVILTGAGGGIGKAVAEKLANEKMNLILLGGNNIAKLEKTAEIVKKYTSCTIIPGDLTNPDFIESAIQEITGRYNIIDVLINNAGMAQNTPFENITLEEFDKIMAVNVRVPFMLTQKVLPLLKKIIRAGNHQYRFCCKSCRISASKYLQRIKTCIARYD